MCLYPKLIRNKKYMPTRKNGYMPPQMKDQRTQFVPVGCGNCIECRRQKAREWQVRLHEELKNAKYGYFVTLTFTNEALDTLCKELNVNECNAVATIGVRRFLERWRKKHKKSVKHWLITELGHTGTERIHLHGLLFTNEPLTTEKLEVIWSYGMVYVGEYCNEKTINYIVKYVTKIDTDHKNYKNVILCSAGLGKGYITEARKQMHKYRPNNTREYYRLNNGAKVNLPIYYRNKLFTEDEREKLWLELLDKHRRYINGVCINNVDSAEGERRYMRVLQTAQRENEELGYGTDEAEWKAKDYAITWRMLQKAKQLKENELNKPP